MIFEKGTYSQYVFQHKYQHILHKLSFAPFDDKIDMSVYLSQLDSYKTQWENTCSDEERTQVLSYFLGSFTSPADCESKVKQGNFLLYTCT